MLDPLFPDPITPGASHRVCQTCYEETNSVPNRLHLTNNVERIVVDQERLTIPGSLTRRQSSSQLSDLAEYVNQLIPSVAALTHECSCPVCNQNLDEVGDAQAQEAHVKRCLEGTSGTPQSGVTIQPTKYLVYDLPAESRLLGVECKQQFGPSRWQRLTQNRCHLLRRICQGYVRMLKSLLYSDKKSGSNVARLSCFCSFHSGMIFS